MEGNTLLLSTGYLIDYLGKNNWDEKKNFIREISVNIIKAIESQDLYIVLVGEKESNRIPSFKRFCKLLDRYVNYRRGKASVILKRFNVIYKSVIFRNWHGKVAIKYYRDNSQTKILGSIVGSSNLTLPALIPKRSPWNREADLYIINGNIVKGSALVETQYSIEYCRQQFKKYEEDLIEATSQLEQLGIKYEVPIYEKCKSKEEFWRKIEDMSLKCRGRYINLINNKGWVNNKYRVLESYEKIFELFCELGGLNRISKTLRSLVAEIQEKVIGAIDEIEKIYQYDSDIIIFNDIILSLKAFSSLNVDRTSNEDLMNMRRKIKVLIKMLNSDKNIKYNDQVKIVMQILEDLYRNTSKSIKHTLSLNTIFNVSVKDTYTESILIGIYNEMEEIVQKFTIKQYP